ADLVVPDPENPGEVKNITSPKDIRLLPAQIRRCIIGWSWDRSGNFVLKLANKTPNVELIARHLGMFVDRKEIKVGRLEQASEDEIDNKITEFAREIAEQRGMSVDAVLAELASVQPDTHVH
ncbi:MAG TPA: hypothetical protein DIU11_14865, partial [Pusillimonas sp.]|nr:hypothetical protein [Pusillimonas sp.]